MARPREFDEDQALEQAMCLFWNKGFRATTPNDLLAAMGIGKSSFYATFGSKKELFLRCIEHYYSLGVQRMTVQLAGPDTVQGVRDLMLGVIANKADDGRARGCLLVNTIAEASQWDDEVGEAVRQGTRRLEAVFVQAVRNIRQQAGNRKTKDIVMQGRFLLNALFGLQVLVKSGSDKQLLNDVVEHNMAMIG